MQIILFVNYNQRISPARAIMQALFCPNALLCDVPHHMNVMHPEIDYETLDKDFPDRRVVSPQSLKMKLCGQMNPQEQK